MDRITEIINKEFVKYMKAVSTCQEYMSIKQLITDCINAVRESAIPKPHKKIIFVSHKFSDNPNGNRLKVETICTSILRQGMFALSPLHMFSFYSNDDDRDIILAVCRYLIDISDEVWIYGYSTGCIAELSYALSIGKKVVIKATGEDKERLEAYITYWEGLHGTA